MNYNIKPKDLSRQERGLPQTISQLIQKYKLDAIWENIEKIVQEVIEQNSGYVMKRDGIMYIADSNMLEEANTVLRIGKNFLDLSKNGIDGNYETIISLDGIINANFIQTGQLNANRIKGGTLTLGGENNVSGKFQILDGQGEGILEASKDGFLLQNGTKLIGSNGILSQFQFGESEWKLVGYLNETYPVMRNSYQFVNIPIYIPDNFEIQEAKVVLRHAPVKWDDNIGAKNIWGYSRNIKLYQQDEQDSFYKEYPIFPSEDYSDVEILTNEIEGAFGESGFTAQVANASIHKSEIKVSNDIKDYIKTGFSLLQIRTGNDIPTIGLDVEYDSDGFNAGYQSNVFKQTGVIQAFITITGFIK